MTLVFQHPERLWIAIGIAVLAAIYLAYVYRRSLIQRPLRLAAQLCKISAWIVLALLLADPVWSHQSPKTGENDVVILADNSASLDTSEQPGKPTRAAEMKQALIGPNSTPPQWLNEISNTFRVKTTLVDERMQNVADFSSLTHQGARSDIARALNTLRQNSTTNRLAAVVLISDGNATDIAQWQSSGIGTIFPVLIGNDAPTPDLAIADCTVTQTAFEDTPVTITTQITQRGFTDKDIAVCALDEEGKPAATEKIKFKADNELKAVRLQVPVTKPGVAFFRVIAMEAGLLPKLGKDEWKSAAKEATLKNNERLLAVDRGEGPYRVLYVSGRPNWEYKFLKRALASDLEMQLPSLVRIAKREPKFEWRGRTGETSNPLFRGFGQQQEAQRYDQPVLIRLGTRDQQELINGFPKAPEDLFGEYRAIVLDDLEAGFFTAEQLHLIERFVSERGGALLMLGGQESFQAGGYNRTPVGDMLPVYLDRSATTKPVANSQFNLTREGWLEPWLRLRTDRVQDEQRLAEVPTFYSVNQVFSIKPGASVLATVTDPEQTPHPALAAQRFGQGKVAAMMVGDLWRWGMKDETARNDMERTWRQLMRWLVVDVPDRVEFTATPEADKVKLSVRVRDRSFHPLDNAVVKIEVTPASFGSNKKSDKTDTSLLYAEPSLKEAGLFEAEFYARNPGAFRAIARVEQMESDTKDKAGPPLPPKATGWVHDPVKDEFASLAPNRTWMQQLAQETGGELLTLQDLPRLPSLLKNIRTHVEETVTEPIWHAPWTFALLLGLLLGEWWLRRKGGLA